MIVYTQKVYALIYICLIDRRGGMGRSFPGNRWVRTGNSKGGQGWSHSFKASQVTPTGPKMTRSLMLSKGISNAGRNGVNFTMEL